jgi:hypothetical protein
MAQFNVLIYRIKLQQRLHINTEYSEIGSQDQRRNATSLEDPPSFPNSIHCHTKDILS